MSENIKDKWSVWTAKIFFDDGTDFKYRPVIVLSDRIILCIVMGVTSKEKIHRHGYKIKHWEYAGLKTESWVRFEQLEIGSDKFGRELGMLHPDDIEGIQRWINDISHGHSRYKV